MKITRKTNIKGIGTDIIEIERLRLAYTRRGNSLLDKLFSENEKKYCFKYKDPFPHFAARFAAKEAIVKAFGLGFGKEISFKDLEIINNTKGKPEVNLSSDVIQKYKDCEISISISHSEFYAIAFCIIQSN